MAWNLANDIQFHLEQKAAQKEKDPLGRSPLGPVDSLVGSMVGYTQEGADKKRTAINRAGVERDYKVDYELATGKDWTPGMSESQAKSGIREGNKKQQFDIVRETNTINDNRPDAVLNRGLLERQQLQAESDSDFNRITRQQDVDFRRDQLVRDNNLQVMQMGLLEQAENNKMYLQEQQIANQQHNRKQDRMQALIAALATLGSGFAI